MLELQFDHLPSSLPISAYDDDDIVGDLEYITLPHVTAPDFEGILAREGVVFVGGLSHIASCKKSGVSGKPNACKRSLTYMMYLANAIASVAKGYARVEEHKTRISKEMTTLLIASNEIINKGDNDILLKIAQLQMEA